MTETTPRPTPLELAQWNKMRGVGMTSAIGEYTPAEFWELLDAYVATERDRAELMEALRELKESSAIVLNWTPEILNSRAVVLKRDIETARALLTRLKDG